MPDLDAPTIPPVSGRRARPVWSVMIPTYNCTSYLKQTLRSVLAFGLSSDEMQIEVVDNCSTADDPEAMVNAIGASRVGFYRQPENVGPMRNFNTCIERSRGQLVHILHSDDYVNRGFYTQVASIFQQWPDVAGVFTRCYIVNDSDELMTVSDRLVQAEHQPTRDARWIYYNCPIRTPGVVVKRAFYETHGGFLPGLVHTADWEMWVRVITRGSAIAVNHPLATYRARGDNLTSQQLRSGECWRDYIRFDDMCASTDLPEFDSRRFRDGVARLALAQSKRSFAKGDSEAARANREVWTDLARPILKASEGIRSLRYLLPG